MTRKDVYPELSGCDPVESPCPTPEIEQPAAAAAAAAASKSSANVPKLKLDAVKLDAVD